jgi:NADH:ubiquinone oxidoreductase subunit 4 (subunit M)
MILRREGRAKTVVVILVTAGIVLPGGVGFVAKFVQFVRTLQTETGGGFTIVPIMNYLLVAAGFGCLLVWATARGMFRDIEKPKQTMLDRERALDEREGRRWSE